MPFFKSFSDEHPGKFPSAVDHPAADGKTEKKIDLVSEGGDVQSVFFDTVACRPIPMSNYSKFPATW